MLNWYCAITNPNCEGRARLGLTAWGYRVFMPELRKWASHARARKVVHRPILPRYLFVEVDPHTQGFGPVRAIHGIEGFITNQGTPVAIPGHFVEDLICRQLSGEFDQIEKEALPIGARVRIIEGQFDELLATITSMKGHRATVKLFGTNSYVRLSEYSLRPA